MWPLICDHTKRLITLTVITLSGFHLHLTLLNFIFDRRVFGFRFLFFKVPEKQYTSSGPLGFHVENFRPSYHHHKNWVTFFPNELMRKTGSVLFCFPQNETGLSSRGFCVTPNYIDQKNPSPILFFAAYTSLAKKLCFYVLWNERKIFQRVNWIRKKTWLNFS